MRFNSAVFGAESGTRTHTVSLPADFESAASTNSAISAELTGGILALKTKNSKLFFNFLVVTHEIKGFLTPSQ